MKSFLSLLGLILLAFGLSMSLTGCGCEGEEGEGLNCGTGTGNPADGVDAEMPVEFLPTNEVVSNICRKLTECNPALTEDTCTDGLKARPDIDTEVGFDVGTFATYGDAIKADLGRKVHTFLYEFNECLDGLTALTCSDPLVTGAYNSGDADAFAGVPLMFPNVCSGMFVYDP